LLYIDITVSRPSRFARHHVGDELIKMVGGSNPRCPQGHDRVARQAATKFAVLKTV